VKLCYEGKFWGNKGKPPFTLKEQIELLSLTKNARTLISNLENKDSILIIGHFPSCSKSLFQSEAKCEYFILMQINLIFIRTVLQLAPF